MRYAIIRIEPNLFETPATLFQAITPKRWELLDKLQGKAALSIRELAKQLGRDVKNVHADVSRLLDIGLLERDESGRVFSPFAEIRTEFTLKGEAQPIAA